MMQAVSGDHLDSAVEQEYMEIVHKHAPLAPYPERIDRHTFYARAQDAFAIMVTGELRKYGNLIVKKGVTPAWETQMETGQD